MLDFISKFPIFGELGVEEEIGDEVEFKFNMSDQFDDSYLLFPRISHFHFNNVYYFFIFGQFMFFKISVDPKYY
jgi:hypothetical protein